jgi:hypothetical protein
MRGSEYERPEEIRGYWWIRLKSGRLIGFMEAVRAVKSARYAYATAFSRVVKLAEKQPDLELRDDDFERAEWLLDDMESYVNSCRRYLEKLRGTRTKQERIAALRIVAGRTPEEAALFLAKADELERGLGA